VKGKGKVSKETRWGLVRELGKKDHNPKAEGNRMKPRRNRKVRTGQTWWLTWEDLEN